MKSKKENNTESISVRIDSDLKKRFFEYLEKEERVFSKWLRNTIRKELKQYEDSTKDN